MALFKDKKLCSYEVIREGDEIVLKINCSKCTFLPSVEDNPQCMLKTMSKLIEVGNATKIVFSQKRDYEYDYEQTQLLVEIAKAYKKISRQKKLFEYTNFASDGGCTKCSNYWYSQVKYIIFNLFLSDPIGAYVELKRLLRREKINLDKTSNEECIDCEKKFISMLEYLINILEKTKLIEIAKPYIAGFKIGDRTVYRQIFYPTIKPDFMFTKLMASYPSEGDELASYTIGENEVTIFSVPGTVQYLYHILPPEFKISEEKYDLLDKARKIISEYQPKQSEFINPERMRQVFYNIGHDLIDDLAEHENITLKSSDVEELTNILVRYTVGFGLIEVLLEDEKVQDITINSPMGQIPIFIVHQDFGECSTNIIPTRTESESWASKLRMLSGRPLDEANPILDTELSIPNARARVAVISAPINPTGIAYAFRRHRDNPWTLPLFVKNKMISPLAAGLLSFIIDGSRTILVAGTRSAGKSSLLGAIMVEIMRKYRIITIEDTLELPVDSLRKLGYNIQSMKVAAAMTRGTTEVSADEGIRTTLRMGDSCLIVGEVRSVEALALYEAMRIGALANVVAGTIHGDSPYGVYDRVVNDLKVPKTSFKATDIIVVANPIKSPDGLHKWRRVTEITEVRKHWENDPMLEGGFSDLMKYDPKNDQLEPSKDVINGDSDVLKAIAGNVKEWASDWDAVWSNIMLRANIKQKILDYSNKLKMPDILEADFVINSNDEFHRISDKIHEEVGCLDSKRILNDWEEWLKKELKNKKAS
ncbi:MAG: type II/IV secretion system ATPase subunit [Candidatus Nanoarchaeia archaeon]|nr:type II/IV secretion system ATPase subunit [Candidatus Nanoarchaeia archaeon]